MRQQNSQFAFLWWSIAIAMGSIGWLAWLEYTGRSGTGLLMCLALPVGWAVLALMLNVFFHDDANQERRQYRIGQLHLTMLFAVIFFLPGMQFVPDAGEIGRIHTLQSKEVAHILLDFHQQQNEQATHILDPGDVSAEEMEWLEDRVSWNLRETTDGWVVDFGFPSGFLNSLHYQYTTTQPSMDCSPMQDMNFWYFCGNW